MSEEFKYICQSCGGHIAYDHQYVGRIIQCPHCEQDVTLTGADPSTLPDLQMGETSQLVESHAVVRRIRSSRPVAAVIALVLLVAVAGFGMWLAKNYRKESERAKAADLVQARVEADRITAEAEKAKAEAEIAKLKEEEKKKAEADAKAAEEAEAAASAKAAKLEAEAKARLEEERKTRAKRNPAVWALWEEADHEAIQLVGTRQEDATVKHKGAYVTAKYNDIPEWLRIAAQTKHKEDGEAKGLIRELDGQTYDLRTSPAGWLTLPMAEVIQIVEDGYLLIDYRSLKEPYAQTKVFKLKHTGLARILNTGDRIQVTAMSVGTYTYENKLHDIKTVPVYDPGMPVGPLREKVVTMRGKPATVVKRSVTSVDEPIATGSGFFISEDGLFITNAHVVEDGTRVEVRTAAGKKRATVLRLDADKDLVLCNSRSFTMERSVCGVERFDLKRSDCKHISVTQH